MNSVSKPREDTAVIYSRVSTKDQDYKSQFTDLKEWATSNNYNVLKSFGEVVSGYDLNAERSEFKRMKEFIEENDVKNILCWEISRLGRSTLRMIGEIEYFASLGVNIFFKKEGLHSLRGTSANKMILNIFSSVAEMERDTIVERASRGLREKAKMGRRIGMGILPLGYRADKQRPLEIEEEEADFTFEKRSTV